MEPAIRSIFRLIENNKDSYNPCRASRHRSSLPDTFSRQHRIHSASDDLESGAALAATHFTAPARHDLPSKYSSEIKVITVGLGIGPKSQPAIQQRQHSPTLIMMKLLNKNGSRIPSRIPWLAESRKRTALSRWLLAMQRASLAHGSAPRVSDCSHG